MNSSNLRSLGLLSLFSSIFVLTIVAACSRSGEQSEQNKPDLANRMFRSVVSNYLEEIRGNHSSVDENTATRLTRVLTNGSRAKGHVELLRPLSARQLYFVLSKYGQLSDNDISILMTGESRQLMLENQGEYAVLMDVFLLFEKLIAAQTTADFTIHYHFTIINKALQKVISSDAQGIKVHPHSIGLFIPTKYFFPELTSLNLTKNIKEIDIDRFRSELNY